MAWLALIAVLTHLLTPIIASQAVSDGNGHGFAEVCTATGGTMRMIADEDAGNEPASSNGSMRCVLCLTACAIAPPPGPVQAGFAPRLDGARRSPTRLLAAPRPPFAWALTQSRAPPPV